MTRVQLVSLAIIASWSVSARATPAEETGEEMCLAEAEPLAPQLALDPEQAVAALAAAFQGDDGADGDDGDAAPAKPAGPPCSTCPNGVTIDCSGSCGYAADPQTCTLYLPPDACTVWGFTHGQVIDPGDILDRNDRRPPPTAGSIDVIHYCAAKHEARHLCDQPGLGSCLSEVYAFAYDYMCLKNWFDDYCPGQASAQTCQELADELQLLLAAKDFNQCACSKTTEAECAVCVEQCQNRAIDVPDAWCETLDDHYCPPRF